MELDEELKKFKASGVDGQKDILKKRIQSLKDEGQKAQQRMSTITDQINKNEVLIENNQREDQEYDQRLQEEE